MVSSFHRLSLNPFRQKNVALYTNTINNNHYHEACLWRCENKHSNRVHIIHGPLAKILNEYSQDYCLTYLGHEQSCQTYKKVM
jgi:hypothetical protein